MGTTMENTGTALLVVDAQTGVLAQCYQRDEVVARISSLVDRARQSGTPVVWVQHCSEEFPENSQIWQITPELAPADDEPRVNKRYGDAFEETTLTEVLTGLDAGHLVVCGAMTDACIRCTAHGGLARGYGVTLVSDAHTGEDMREWGSPISAADAIAYTNLYWSFTSVPGRQAALTEAAAVAF